ncbi:M23 family metallopeptidase [Chitinophagaceae bacterium LB-8]|uniref:M23 family metallopeptidase n=1 Tax=Paraflavisolibacter caeni TaxID=2982496 RepID=A0A9X3BJE5_9BACT|nr:M23 family metallopeptidase [Paraflavisolibacter caeni]MCU7551093.1 M23 family metallopeptidase [Paraflavisolibacter caeni]
MKLTLTTVILLFFLLPRAQEKDYPNGYFRHPLNVPMALVANFGELRPNHWHMGLDIRTQQRENLPVYAAADGYITKVKIEPSGFGRAIYIAHPNGYTTLYAHLNDFYPALEQYIKEQQYRLESWAVELTLPPFLFSVKKGDFIAYSGNTGGSQGPHVHFEIRDTKTDNCLNPLLFGFPIPDAVPPTISRLAMYDANKSVYMQSPQMIPIRKTGANYTLAMSNLLKVGSNKLSFAIGASDRFSGSANPVGVYCAKIFLDGVFQSGFVLDSIDYNETRYINAQIDYRYKHAGGPYLQHLNKMPGDTSNVYTSTYPDAAIVLPDTTMHSIKIEVMDAALNTSVLAFNIQYNGTLAKPIQNNTSSRLVPQNVNIFESDNFELYTSEYTIYDTVPITFSNSGVASGNAVSPVYTFCSAAIPSHDSVTVRIKPSLAVAPEDRDKVIIKSISGSRTVVGKAKWQNGWFVAKFRQFGTYQAFIDQEPPSVNAPVTDLRRASRLVFVPTDNFKEIKMFRAEVDGQWLRFTNDKGYSYIYKFDEKFPQGEHSLKVIVEDEAGNVTEREWRVVR